MILSQLINEKKDYDVRRRFKRCKKMETTTKVNGPSKEFLVWLKFLCIVIITYFPPHPSDRFAPYNHGVQPSYFPTKDVSLYDVWRVRGSGDTCRLGDWSFEKRTYTLSFISDLYKVHVRLTLRTFQQVFEVGRKRTTGRRPATRSNPSYLDAEILNFIIRNKLSFTTGRAEGHI